MGRIALLDQEVINQIAAGEVVERPASVVKELLENAIDAGATQVTVEIKDAGLKEIKVIDNGSGMTREDAILAIERHATSKITTMGDLNCIETLGFRGEALPAIASVSRFTLITRTPGEVSGTKLTVVGGKIQTVSPVGCPPGTQVTVQDLFFNTPPRRKFLKSPRTEAGIISDLIGRFALGYPEISFRYYSGKRLCFTTNGQGNPLEVIGILYGNEAMRQFVEIFHQDEGIRLHGFVSRPEYTRTSRYYQSFFVNRRLVHNTFLNHALENAFWGFITKGHFPLAVLYLRVDPSTIDVNVHPTKREVRFGDSNLVAGIIQHGVRNALAGQQFPSFAAMPETPSSSPVYQEKPTYFPRKFHEQRLPFNLNIEAFPVQGQTPVEFQSLNVIGQVQGTYIVAEREGDVYFIDQHAAHERIRYEAITEQFKAKEFFLQRLGAALEIKLTPDQRELYEEHRQIIDGLGYTLKEGQNDMFSLVTVPADLRDDPEQCFLEILDLLRETADVKKDRGTFYDRLATLVACKTAIKAGDRLSLEEMQKLLEQLDTTAQSGNCPHGRPTYFKLTSSELAKRFYRT